MPWRISAVFFVAQSGCARRFVAFNRKVMLGCRAIKVRSLSFDADSINCANVAEISSIGMKINTRGDTPKSSVFHFFRTAYCPKVAVLELFPGIFTRSWICMWKMAIAHFL